MRRYVEGVLRFRLLVIGLALLVSGILGFQIRNLRVVVDPNATLPRSIRTFPPPEMRSACFA